MARRRVLVSCAVSLLAFGGCAGPIETHAGLQGAGLSRDASVALVSAPQSDGPVSEDARRAVATELQRRGLKVSDAGSVRILVTLAERPASLAVLATDGAVISAAKQHRLLQDCADRTQRLSLVAENPDGQVTRAWAQEAHCKADLAETLQPLAAVAVARLLGESPQQRELRFGQD